MPKLSFLVPYFLLFFSLHHSISAHNDERRSFPFSKLPSLQSTSFQHPRFYLKIGAHGGGGGGGSHGFGGSHGGFTITHGRGRTSSSAIPSAQISYHFHVVSAIAASLFLGFWLL